MDNIMGLLGGVNEEEIRNQALGSAALQAGLAGLMASGPSLTPVSSGQILGQAGSVGIGAYQQGLQQAQQQQMQRQTQQAIQGVLGGQGAGGKIDTSALADKYMQLGVAFSGVDPQRAKFYLDAAKDMKEKTERFTGGVANAALELFGTADIGKLTQEQRTKAQQHAQSLEMQQKAAGAPKMSVNVSDPTAVSREVMSIRNNYVKEIGDASALASTYQNLLAASNDPNPIGDVTLVFGFYKMIDPTSTVREGEYDTLLKSASIPDRIKNYVRKVQTGEKLTPTQRQEIVNAAYNRIESKRNSVNEAFNVHSKALKTLNLDPNQYLTNPFANIESAKRQPAQQEQPQQEQGGQAAPRVRRWNPQTKRFEE